MMPRFELLKMSYGYASPIPLGMLRDRLAAAGARTIREAYANGWRNQPRTLRFSAPDDGAAKRIADAVNDPGAPFGQYREYGLHWAGFGK